MDSFVHQNDRSFICFQNSWFRSERVSTRHCGTHPGDLQAPWVDTGLVLLSKRGPRLPALGRPLAWQAMCRRGPGIWTVAALRRGPREPLGGTELHRISRWSSRRRLSSGIGCMSTRARLTLKSSNTSMYQRSSVGVSINVEKSIGTGRRRHMIAAQPGRGFFPAAREDGRHSCIHCPRHIYRHCDAR